jgi:alkyl hydroperoxide reductase subunit F
MQPPLYDVIIIGAGPAGITAAVYAARKRMQVLVVTVDIGGQTAWSGDVENYTGYQFVSGPELAQKFEEHLRAYGIALRENEPVQGISKDGDIVVVATAHGRYRAKSCIIASGKRSRELNVPGEVEFKNKGVTYCATCDGPLFTGKDVAVIGGGNSGLDAALQLTKIARHIDLITNQSALGGDQILREQVTKSPLVAVHTDVTVKAIRGDRFVRSLVISQSGVEKTLAVSGIFVEIGLVPNTDFATIVDKNQWGEIIVTKNNETSVPGIFAAGDVTDVPEKQIIIAAGEGSKALLAAYKYLVHTTFAV